MYHLHTLIHMSYVYPQIFLTRQGNTTTIEAPFLGSGCGRVVQGAGRKAKRMVLQCINGVGSNPVEGRTNKYLTALKSNSNTVWFNFQTYIYIYSSYCHKYSFLVYWFSVSVQNIQSFEDWYLLILCYDRITKENKYLFIFQCI